MKHNRSSQPTKRHILWLLAQLKGLALALKLIHDMTSPNKNSEDVTKLLTPTQQGVRKCGWHHDLKPENILYFGEPGDQFGSFHIADFGSGKVQTYRSGSRTTASPNGTLTYEPPEAAKGGRTSRPYDIWSMGCVFLALLIWTFYDHESVEAFSRSREMGRYPGSYSDVTKDDAFWQREVNGTIQRRQSVESWLVKLDAKLGEQQLQPFREVLTLVKRMLEIKREIRITALDLWDTLQRIYDKTKVELQRFEGYSLPYQSHGEAPSPSQLSISTKAPDRRTPDLEDKIVVHEAKDQSPGSPMLTPISANYLAASTQASPAHSRNNSGASAS